MECRPELEDRHGKSYLLFYPFHLETVANITVEPIPPTEVGPTPAETEIIEEAKVVENVGEAEKVVEGVKREEEGKLREGRGEERRKGWFW